jgi:hypothetical protein
VLHASVAGVVWPSLVARMVSAVLITRLVFRERDVRYRPHWVCAWNGSPVGKIGATAIPNGAENVVFQLVKVARRGR